MTRLFVYGTLVPGGRAWPHLARWVTGATERDAVPGELYDTGRGYPCARFGAGHGLVHGVVVTLDAAAVDGALAALDRYEGEQYARVRVRTRSGLDVFSYTWIAPLDGCTPLAGGRWPLPGEGP